MLIYLTVFMLIAFLFGAFTSGAVKSAVLHLFCLMDFGGYSVMVSISNLFAFAII
jgi:hypothetical protein